MGEPLAVVRALWDRRVPGLGAGPDPGQCRGMSLYCPGSGSAPHPNPQKINEHLKDPHEMSIRPTQNVDFFVLWVKFRTADRFGAVPTSSRDPNWGDSCI